MLRPLSYLRIGLEKLIRSRLGLLACISLVAVVYVLSINVVWLTSYTITLIELSRSMYRGSFEIDRALCIYVDTFMINDKCFFAGPPGVPLILSPIIGLSGSQSNPLLLGGLSMALSGAIAFVLAYKLSSDMGYRVTALPASLIVAFAGPLWIYSAQIFPQAPLSASLTGLVLLSIVAVRGGLGYAGYAGIGFLSSLSILLDPSLAVTVICVVLILAIKTAKDLFSGVITRSVFTLRSLFFLAGMMPLAIFLIIYNTSITGNPLDFPEMHLLRKLGIENSGFTNSPVAGLYTIFLDFRKGLIPLYPVLVPAILAIPFLVKNMQPYVRAIYISSLAMPILVYSLWYDSDGGLSYGPRFAVPFTVLLAPAISLLLEKARSGAARLAIIAIATYSIAENAIVAVTTPYPSSLEQLYPWENQFIHTSVPLLWSSTRSCYLYELLSRTGLDTTTSTLISISVLMIVPLILILTTLSDLQAYLSKALKLLRP